MDLDDKFVDFEKWCKSCVYCDVDEVKDPCNICLDNTTNYETTKPTEYKEKK